MSSESIGASKAARLQHLDGLIGPPLCLLLDLVDTLNPFRPAPPKAGKPASIAFVKLGEQGSTVLAIPAIQEAVRRVGRERVFFIVFSENRKILDALDLIPQENVVEIRTASLPSFFGSVWAAIRRMRALPLDAVIDLDFFARSSAILARLTGARWRVGLHAYFGEGPYRGQLMTHRPRYNPHLHTSRLFYSLVKALDQPAEAFPTWHDPGPQPSLPRLTVDPAKMEAMHRRLCEIFRTDSLPRIVLLNANCSDMIPLRRWESARFVELARRILAEFPDTAIAFTGAPIEQTQADELAKQVGSPRCVCMAGRTSLDELFALYSHSTILVTNDSGPAHFASLTPARVIALFGPETPALFGPISEGSVALTAGLPCSPCVSAQNNRLSACKNNLCMQSISVDRVMEEVRIRLVTKDNRQLQREHCHAE
ncbi:MAG: hypothetical protein Fur0032_18200 [Terrimicrobiaceae bacterium]